MLTDTATLQLSLDLVGVFVFALSGALVAVRIGLDLFGVLVLAWIAGLGGGILRDLLLGITPPVGVSNGWLLAAAVVAGLLVFLLHGRWQQFARRNPDARWGRVPSAVRVLDAAGLGVFAVSGALVALDNDAGPLAAPSSAASRPSGAASSATSWRGGCPRCCSASCMPCPRSSVLRSSCCCTTSGG